MAYRVTTIYFAPPSPHPLSSPVRSCLTTTRGAVHDGRGRIWIRIGHGSTNMAGSRNQKNGPRLLAPPPWIRTGAASDVEMRHGALDRPCSLPATVHGAPPTTQWWCQHDVKAGARQRSVTAEVAVYTRRREPTARSKEASPPPSRHDRDRTRQERDRDVRRLPDRQYMSS